MRSIHTCCLLLAALVTHSMSAQAQPADNSGARSETPETASSSAPASAPPEATLQEPKPSQGHFIAVGAYAVGAMAFDKNRGTRNPSLGQGFSLRLGEAVTDWLDLSLSIAYGSTHGPEENKLGLGRLGIQSQWYLSRQWFVPVGFGVTNVQGPDPEDHKLNRGRYGDVYWAGIGTNMFISDGKQSGGWVLTPVAMLEVGPDRNFTTTALWIGLEFSWWGGLTKDKLQLPVSEAYQKRKSR